jgi:hypothetical protein
MDLCYAAPDPLTEFVRYRSAKDRIQAMSAAHNHQLMSDYRCGTLACGHMWGSAVAVLSLNSSGRPSQTETVAPMFNFCLWPIYK